MVKTRASCYWQTCGFCQLMEQLARERMIIASLCAGMAEFTVLEAIRYRSGGKQSAAP